MAKESKKKRVLKKYRDLDEELADLYVSVAGGNPISYRKQYEEIQGKYFSDIGKDPSIDFNIAFAHLPAPDPVDLVNMLQYYGKDLSHFIWASDSITGEMMNRGLIGEFNDPASIIEAFGYLKDNYKYYSGKIDNSSLLITNFIRESVCRPMQATKTLQKLSDQKDLIGRIRNNQYCKFWDEVIGGR